MDSNMKAALAGAAVTGVISLGLLFVQNGMVSKEAVERLSDYFDVVDDSMSYESALQAIYSDAQSIKEEYVQLQDIVSEQEKLINALNSQLIALSSSEETVADAKRYAELGEYDSALRLLRSVNDRSDEMDVLLSEYTEKYISQVVERANALKAAGELDDALELVVSTLDILPGNQTLSSLQQDIEDSYPLNMVDVVPAYETDGNPYREYSLLKGTESFKMGGVKYYNGMTFNADYNVFNDKCWAIYNLSGEYSSLEFTIGHVDGTDTGNANALQIIFDGVLSQEVDVSPDMFPKQVAIDVTGVQQLKFQLPSSGGDNPLYGLGNPVLRKAQ